ncbi:hypothetical protein HMPREF2708_10535 [Corynebacterium sp. HMSC073H12]|uniref:DUF2190 family protein n=1 Tax=Corynebacterium sp. HMSC073H12 TaxID=1715187 RepID=UPI000911BDD1|nr:DUF2190 family protein [Corynebacterium sp. HMSC073H12]OHQ78518.1 hypothetical protein HMPREF2708_10535 [Corynebacterium sp. HMSC073H12]
MASTPMHFTPATNITGKAQGDIAQGTFVVIAADMEGRNPVVKAATADADAFGVAAHDAKDGEHFTIYRLGIYELVASGAIAAGDKISTAAGGKAKKATDGPVAGVAVTKAANGTVTVALD